MAHFRGTLQGQRGEASRLGSAKTGLEAHINGWNKGIEVRAYVDEKSGEDKFIVWLTSGSNGHTQSREIGEY